MIVGVPKETKPQENRIALTPAGTHTLVRKGHTVCVQASAGVGSGFSDETYTQVGARIAPNAEAVFGEADLILKVKEPQEAEYGLLRCGQMLFTYLHIAPLPALGRALIESGATAIAYETVALPDGRLPLLVPMSEVAGRMAVQVGAYALEKQVGGRGVLLGGLPGVRSGRVVIIGGGVVGSNAARIAVGMGADVALMDIDLPNLAKLDLVFQGRLQTVASNSHMIEEEISAADLVIGAVLVTGAETPHLVTREMVRGMKPGAVIVDVDIDQGGCIETSRPTTHEAPTYLDEGVVHYCVANMPGAVARTATLGLTNATLPYVLRLADGGLEALVHDPALAQGLNIHAGNVTHPVVAEALGVDCMPFSGA